MKTRMISLVIVTLCASTGMTTEVAARDGHWRSGPSHHAQYHDRGRYERRGPSQRHARHAPRPWSHSNRPPPPRHYGPPKHAYHPARYGPPRHVRHHHYRAPYAYVRPYAYRPVHWSRGHHLPRPYYAPTYYVDYRPYRLAPPPYGHHWVRVDHDVLLVALTTGLIVDAVYGLFR